MNGRFFDGRQVIAYISSGHEKFTRSNDKKFEIEGMDAAVGDGNGTTDADERRRLDKFGSWLEEDGSASGGV